MKQAVQRIQFKLHNGLWAEAVVSGCLYQITLPEFKDPITVTAFESEKEEFAQRVPSS